MALTPVRENDINNGKTLSDEQIERITITVIKLAENSNNAQAITLAHNLKMSKTIDDKKKWIVLFYLACFQLLSFINVARDKDLSVTDYKIELDNLFKGKNGKA
jgi:hypothetical protein